MLTRTCMHLLNVDDLLDACMQLGVIEYTEKAKELFPEDVS